MLSIDLKELEGFKVFELVGDIEPLLTKKRIWTTLKYSFEAYKKDESIIIPVQDSVESTHKNLLQVLEKHSLISNTKHDLDLELDLFRQEEESFKIHSEKARGIWWTDFESSELTDFVENLKTDLPNRRLTEKQLLASFHLAFSKCSCNFSVPGAGKTSTVYGAYSYLKKNTFTKSSKKINKLMVVGPYSCFGPWEKEYKECFGNRPSSKRLNGDLPFSERQEFFRSPCEEELILVSLATLANHVQDVKFFLENKNHNVMLVIDEAHHIKNTQGGIHASSVLEVAPFADSRVILTGTPAPNGYQDLYNLFKFIWPNRNVIGFGLDNLKYMSENPNDARIPALIDNLKPFFIRTKKKDLGLPDAVENPPKIIQMGPVQRRIYDSLRSIYEPSFRSYINKENSKDEVDVFIKAKVIRLRQASTNPMLLKKAIPQVNLGHSYADDLDGLLTNDVELFEMINNYEGSGEIPSKFLAAKELIEEILRRDEKVIVWANFVENITFLSSILANNGIQSRILMGATPTKSEKTSDYEISQTREGIIDEFHEPESEFKVLIANPAAVGESISLHKAPCRNAIYLERDYNAANFLQSKDRIHRVGLPKDAIVNYYYLESNDSIEQEIDLQLRAKEKRLLELIEDQEIPIFNIGPDWSSSDFSYEDLVALVDSYVSGQ